MIVEQIYTGCLAHGAYYIESNGEAAIVDPLREVSPYLRQAEERGAKIKYVLETHFHADFVSGHIDLAKQSGAAIVYGPNAQPNFEAHIAHDGEELKLGDVVIKVLHTPGHTMESSTFLLRDEEGRDYAIFSGDTLFIGDVGRPDLAQKGDLTMDGLARYLFRSLREKIMPLDNRVIVYPGHGAGSACGKNMCKETTDTLGHQKESNYALRADMSEDEFVREVTDGLMPPPAYFPLNAKMNKMGYDSIDEVLARGCRPLSPAAFEAAANETDALLLDTRDPETFAKGFIPNSINIGIDGNFAPWAGALIPDIRQNILLIAEPGRAEEVVTRLARVGYDYTLGYLEGGYEAWVAAGKESDAVPSISVQEFIRLHDADPAIPILDVRKASEFGSEHILGAENTPLDFVNQAMQRIQADRTYYVHCAGGYRSMIFCSILRARGFDQLVNVAGGFKALKETGHFAVTDYVQPTTML
jgi:glyoxylase-like metal-dependent hydrolase (beta-lactamase superfamily II)/rhodanese-related sulfurtransferase